MEQCCLLSGSYHKSFNAQYELGLSHLSPHPLYITITTMLKDIAGAHIPWITDVLVGSIVTTNWVNCPLS